LKSILPKIVFNILFQVMITAADNDANNEGSDSEDGSDSDDSDDSEDSDDR
jgi:hypothetical protein